ncbi:Zinc finger MYND-type containing 10 [Carabus blaptoides fortunei]
MDNVLLSSEVDLFIETIRCYDIESIGLRHWIDWHGRLTKLNQQAVLEATELREEYVKEALVSSGKIPILVHEAILICVWRHKVLPQILKFEPEPSNTFTIYTVLYHEATCIALLETVLFHSNSCETLDEAALDLLDYCTDAATQLLNYKHCQPMENESAQDELRRLQSDLQFDIGIRSISILRYFAEYLESLPLGLTARMLTTLDMPLLMTELINCAPWMRKDDEGNCLKYTGGRWEKLSGERLCKTEAQLWIGLRQILLDPRCLQYYELTDFRKNQLVKLQKYLYETVLDQLSPLIDLKHWLCQLAMSNLPNSAKPSFVLEIVPQMKDSILLKNRNKWKEIAKTQARIFFKDSQNMMNIAQSLSEAYNSEVLEKLENVQVNTCSGCGANAVKKCSRCKAEWYCSRNCQVKHWPQHKEHCDIMVGNNDM